MRSLLLCTIKNMFHLENTWHCTGAFDEPATPRPSHLLNPCEICTFNLTRKSVEMKESVTGRNVCNRINYSNLCNRKFLPKLSLLKIRIYLKYFCEYENKPVVLILISMWVPENFTRIHQGQRLSRSSQSRPTYVIVQ